MITRMVRQIFTEYMSPSQAISQDDLRDERPITAPSAMTQTAGVLHTEKLPLNEILPTPSHGLPRPRMRWAFPLACVSAAAPSIVCVAGAVQASVKYGFRLPMFAVFASLGAFVATSVLLVGVVFLERWESAAPSIPALPGKPFSLPPDPVLAP